MALKTKVTMVSDWVGKLEKATDEGLLEAMTDVHRRAVALAPKETSALANSGKIDRITGGYKLTFGSSRVPYARRRHFENKKNPQTKRYLSKAADSVFRSDTSKYFRRKIDNGFRGKI